MDEILKEQEAENEWYLVWSLINRVRRQRNQLMNNFPGDYYADLVKHGFDVAETYLCHMLKERQG